MAKDRLTSSAVLGDQPARRRLRRVVERQLADLGSDDLVLVGVSGGADSLALARLVADISGDRGLVKAGAVVIDHQLQDGSGDVAARDGERALDSRRAARALEGGTQELERDGVCVVQANHVLVLLVAKLGELDHERHRLRIGDVGVVKLIELLHRELLLDRL
ncbi:MAG: hypothetical protein HQ526_09260 [Actinobacteria bacterium]|nr:hypothetical protein [Actinomycetota bacterium]